MADPTSQPASLAERVRRQLEAQSISVNEVAEALGTSRSRVRRLMAGKRPFDVASLQGIARLLGKDVNALVAVEAEPAEAPARVSKPPPLPPQDREREDDATRAQRLEAQLKRAHRAIQAARQRVQALEAEIMRITQQAGGIAAERDAALEALERAEIAPVEVSPSSVAAPVEVSPSSVVVDDGRILELEAENEALRGLLLELEQRASSRRPRRDRRAQQRASIVVGGLIGMGIENLLDGGEPDP